jgi:hypothetical protein
MAGGKAHGLNRQYQVECRDVLIYRNPKLVPWADDGIDITFDLPDTLWTLDIALHDSEGQLVIAECRRTVGAVKQGDVGEFAYKVELLRRTLDIPVAGIFIAKREHQIGAVRVGQFNGIQTVVLDEASIPPGFTMTFLRYDAERERKCRDILMHMAPASLELSGNVATTLIHGKSSGESDRR